MSADTEKGMLSDRRVRLVIAACVIVLLGLLGLMVMTERVVTSVSTSQDVSDAEAMRICLFSRRSFDSCKKMVQERNMSGSP